MAQLFGYIRKSLREVVDRISLIESPAAADGQFLQITRRLAVIAAHVAAAAAARRPATRPLWEHRRPELAEGPFAAVWRIWTRTRTRARARPRPRIAAGTGAAGG